MEWSVAAVLLCYMLCKLAREVLNRFKPEGGKPDAIGPDAIGFHHSYIEPED